MQLFESKTVNQPQLRNRAKKGLKMRYAFSTNFMSRTIFVLRAVHFGWKNVKNQLLRQNRSSFQYAPQNKNRAPRKIRSLNMCLEIISDWHRPGKLHRNVLPTPPSLSLDPIVRQSWDNCLYRRGGYAKRDGAICWACVHPRAFLRTHLENKFFEPLNSRFDRRIEILTGLPGNSWF